MRDSKRIMPLIIKLGTLWLRHPDLRFLQLVELVKTHMFSQTGLDTYYLEDDDAEKAIDSLIADEDD